MVLKFILFRNDPVIKLYQACTLLLSFIKIPSLSYMLVVILCRLAHKCH